MRVQLLLSKAVQPTGYFQERRVSCNKHYPADCKFFVTWSDWAILLEIRLINCRLQVNDIAKLTVKIEVSYRVKIGIEMWVVVVLDSFGLLYIQAIKESYLLDCIEGID